MLKETANKGEQDINSNRIFEDCGEFQAQMHICCDMKLPGFGQLCVQFTQGRAILSNI